MQIYYNRFSQTEQAPIYEFFINFEQIPYFYFIFSEVMFMAKAEYRSAVRSRKLIHSALADLLQEKPLDKITVTDVVRRAEINRGTFYAHYTNIQDVINHLIQNTFSHIQEALSEPCQSLADVPGILLGRLRDVLEEDMDFYRKIMNSSAAPIMQEQLVNIVVDYMMQREGEFSRGGDDCYLVAIRFGAGGLSNLYLDWFSGRLSCTLEELTQLGEKMLQGVLAGIEG